MELDESGDWLPASRHCGTTTHSGVTFVRETNVAEVQVLSYGKKNVGPSHDKRRW